jgi:hypothetical protein
MRFVSFVLPILLVSITACGSDAPDASKRPLGEFSPSQGSGGPLRELPPGVNAAAAARLDSGNVAFRVKQYDVALGFYRGAADAVPNHAAPWYGIYMVAQATKNTALADSALKAVAIRNGGGELLDTASVKNHKGGEAAGVLPLDHPAMTPPR